MPDSMIPDKEGSIQDWWDKAHKLRHATWLTGSQGPEIWHALKVTGLIKPQTRVLNIGVGMGHCTRRLAELGATVSALDISPSAIDGVRDVIDSGFLASQIDRLPDNSFDLAISNLVAQHMMDEDLETQLRNVIRSLKPSGLFAMQFAFYWDQISPTVNNTAYEAKAGGVCRTLGRVTELVERVNGTITWAQMIAGWPEYRSAWYGVHIVKKPAYSFSYAHFDPSAGFSRWGDTVNAMEALSLQVEGLTKDLAGVAKDRELQIQRVDELSQQLNDAVKDRDVHAVNEERFAHDLQAIRNSKSWQVTRPLRTMMRLLRKIK